MRLLSLFVLSLAFFATSVSAADAPAASPKVSAPKAEAKPAGKAPGNSAAKTKARAAENNLTRSLAEARREQIRSVNYSLEVTFEKGKSEYRAKARIDADLTDTKHPLSLDWLGRKPLALAVNGELLRDYPVKTGWIEIPAKYLAPKTVIAVEFVNAFGTEGEGIQHIIDPEDKEEYVYTDFEPYAAHQLFPCFDQPDLKAHFDLTVTAPASWKALGNELPAEEHADPSSGTTTTRFKTTPLLSPYLFFVGAGPFQEWKDAEGKIPLFLYSRKSLAKYVDAEALFHTLRKGLAFYSEYFAFEYPFSKMALVFAPEFGWGGMENPGAITVNERNLFRGPVPSTRREGRDNLILHEMAHMWFGDLVTMKWWNDLWLNESFATYLATIAQDRAFGSKNAWSDFASSKTWGYWQDQLVTTHPIEAEVKDVRTARGNLDGITYAKGASALQQLHFHVGENSFRDGIQAYFRAHAFGNAERADFVGSIATASGKKLDKWTKAWLQTAGLNRVSVEVACSDPPEELAVEPSAESLTIRQEKSSSGTLSPHTTRVGLFSKHGAEDDTLTLDQTVDAEYEGKSTKLKLEGGVCPTFVFPNLDDKDYALFSLDEESLEMVPMVLQGGIQDPLLRLQLWNMLAQMVRDGKLDPIRYLDFAIAGLAKESDEGILAVLLGRHSGLRNTYETYFTPASRISRAPELEKTIWSRMASAEKGSTRQMLFFDFYARIAQTPEAIERLREIVEKNTPPEGLELDPERRWMILISLAQQGAAGNLVDDEEKRDPSDLARRMAYAARVAAPDKEAKRAFWNAIEHPEKIPPSTLRTAARMFHDSNHPALAESFVKDFFDRVKKVDWKKSDQLVEVYLESLFPGTLCTKKLLNQSKAELKAARNLTDLARRSWLEANDELARCVKVRR